VRKTAVLCIGQKGETEFYKAIKQANPNTTLFLVPKDLGSIEYGKVRESLKNFDQIITVVYDTRKRPSSQLDYNSDLKLLIADISKLNTISVVLANPYTIAGLPGIESSTAIIVGYQNSVEMEKSAAKVILGRLKPSGNLPISINTFFKFGDGIQLN
jgi:beta-N-acetylhexosaminidase